MLRPARCVFSGVRGGSTAAAVGVEVAGAQSMQPIRAGRSGNKTGGGAKMSFRLCMPARLLAVPFALAALVLGATSVAAASTATVSCNASGLPQVTTVNCNPFFVVASGFTPPVTFGAVTIPDLQGGLARQVGARPITTSGTTTIFSVEGCGFNFAGGPITINVREGAQIASANFTFIPPTRASCGAAVQPPPPAPVPNTSATPELDSVLLFGSGLSGIGGYALLRLRARRQRS
jgi:hypothetical protein